MNVPSARAVAKSPIVTPIASAPGFSRSRATIALERSIPCTGTPRWASSTAMRPVPIPSSKRPPVARELDHEVDDWVDGLRLEHRGAGLVVPTGDVLSEIAVLAAHGAESTVA